MAKGMEIGKERINNAYKYLSNIK